MIPLVLQLQAEALDTDAMISDILRKSKVVAAKLRLDELSIWVENELNGYSSSDNLPDYRKLRGRLKALNPFRGWMPAIIDDNDLENIVSCCNITNPIGPLEEMIRQSLDSNGQLIHPFSGSMQSELAKLFGFSTEFQIHIPASVASGILDAIRNRILDWSISLEQAGILGEGMLFSAREKEAAKVMTNSNIYHIQNVGVFGNVAHSSVNANQSANYTERQLMELRTIVDKIDSVAEQLSNDIQKPIVSALTEIRTELETPRPNTTRLRAALTSIRTVCEGAAGNLIATGIAGVVSPFLN